MLSNDEIKDRFHNSGKLIGLDGEYINQNWDTNYFNPGTIKLLHYKLLDGLSDETVTEELRKINLSPFEIKYTLKKAHAFISDILGIDLAEHRASQISTGAECQRKLTEMITDINGRFEAANLSPVNYRDHLFDADQSSQVTIQGSVMSNEVPTYWVDHNNERVSPWSLEDCQALNAAIVERRKVWHEQMTTFKETLRRLADGGKLNEMKKTTLVFTQ